MPGAANANEADRSEPSPPSWLPARFMLEDGREAVIRTMVEDDAEELLKLLPQTHLESNFLNYLPGEFKMTLEEEKDFIREHTGKPGNVAMVVEVDGHIVGIAGAESQKFMRLSHHTEVGLVVVKEFWGQGIGRKLMHCLIRWAQDRRLRKVYLRVFDYNERGIRLYESLGFVEEGRLTGDVLRGDGTYGDTIIMARHFNV